MGTANKYGYFDTRNLLSEQGSPNLRIKSKSSKSLKKTLQTSSPSPTKNYPLGTCSVTNNANYTNYYANSHNNNDTDSDTRSVASSVQSSPTSLLPHIFNKPKLESQNQDSFVLPSKRLAPVSTNYLSITKLTKKTKSPDKSLIKSYSIDNRLNCLYAEEPSIAANSKKSFSPTHLDLDNETTQEYERILNPRKRRHGNRHMMPSITLEQETLVKVFEKHLQGYTFGSHNESYSNYNSGDLKLDVEFYNRIQDSDPHGEKELDYRALYV